MGTAAAEEGARLLGEAISAHGQAFIVVATGSSHFAMYEHLVGMDVNWSKVHAFHLDEYVGIDPGHRASFRRYLRDRFVTRLPNGTIGSFELIDGNATNPRQECDRLAERISAVTVDIAFVGIGENCHLAFNDPPADFRTDSPYLLVTLDEACRRQQMGEGWFASVSEVPRQAISMSCREILRARHIICTVPDQRKSGAVARAVEGPVSPLNPASILQQHPDCGLYLDRPAASLLRDHGRSDPQI